MHHSNIIKPFVASLCKSSPSWEKSLSYYRRSLVECGSPIELEHTQRVALLFQKRTGEANELGSWAKLFTSEGIPTCSLMLKALVSHDLWLSAIKLWEWNPSSMLAGALVDELMNKKMTEQSFCVLQYLLKSESKEHKLQHINSSRELCKIQHLDNDLAMALNDAVQLATDPSFLPSEHQRAQSSLLHLINLKFSKVSQWEEAVSMMSKLLEHDVSLSMRIEILSSIAARKAYHGKKYKDTFNWIKNDITVPHSASLQRTLLRCAIVLRCVEDALTALDFLCNQCVLEVPSFALQDVCRLFIKSYENGGYVHLLDKFVLIVSSCSSRIYSKKLRSELESFFSVNSLYPSTLDLTGALEHTRRSTTHLAGNLTFSDNEGVSISELDRTGSTLFQKGDWESSLEVLKKIVDTDPANEREKVLVEAARTSLGNWESAILFFA